MTSITDLGEEDDTAEDEPGEGEEDGGEEGGGRFQRASRVCMWTKAGEAAVAVEEEGAEGEAVEAVDEEPGGHGWVTFSLHEAKYNADDRDNQGDHLSGEVACQRLE